MCDEMMDISSQKGTIINDTTNKIVIISDGNGQLTLKLDYNSKCLMKEVWVKGRQVLSVYGASSAIRTTDGTWYTTRNSITSPTVNVSGNVVTLSSISYGGSGINVVETWIFTANQGSISWNINRMYLSGGTLSDTYFPGWDFQSISTWTGAILDNGGVAWMKLLDNNSRTLGTHSGTVTFWDKQSNSCLRIVPSVAKGVYTTNRFTKQPNGAVTFCNEITSTNLTTKYDLQNFRNTDDVWNCFNVSSERISVNYDLSALDYGSIYDIGTLNGLDGSAIREMSNTIARYGVIDNNHVGLNGWMSGYICLHEPYLGKAAAAVGQPDYTKAVQDSFSFYKDNAVQTSGRVLSRFQYMPGDEQAGSRTKLGFYEAQWGMLLDSQPGYVIVVADMFNLNGDIIWANSQKSTCEKVLDYLLARDSDNNGLVEMMNSNTSDGRSSDWIDVVWAANENALVNAELYGALSLWADIEDVLGDSSNAATYRMKAANLKNSFNKSIEQGGFWDSTNSQYVYWRDADNSIHGTNMVIPVQFAAIGYGVCDDKTRINSILSNIETKMISEGLFSWPLCMTSFTASETDDTFPNYENGDIFLSWNELGLRSYSKYNPNIAVKYIKNIINKYNSDGLAAQRYFRQSQTGTGDDILAGNYMTIAGLYSSIYGVQPYYNRLYLEPHITSDLDGTILKYQLRGQQYIINLASQNNYNINVSGFTVSNTKPFAMNLDNSNKISCFTGNQKSKAITFTRSNSALLNVDMANYSNACIAWTELPNANITITHTVSQLVPNISYRLFTDGILSNTLTSDSSGNLSFNTALKALTRYSFKLSGVDTGSAVNDDHC